MEQRKRDHTKAQEQRIAMPWELVQGQVGKAQKIESELESEEGEAESEIESDAESEENEEEDEDEEDDYEPNSQNENESEEEDAEAENEKTEPWWPQSAAPLCANWHRPECQAGQ